MSRIIRMFSLLVVSVFSVIILSNPVTAGPVSRPVPLRLMYLKSDLVLIGTVSQAGQWEKIVKNNSEITYRRVLTINVESPIKGASSGEIAVTELRRTGNGKSNFSAGQRRLFFLAAGDNSYFLLSNFHGDLALNERDLEVYAARLRELQNIYLSGDRLGEQVMDWLAAVAADPVTRFDGAYDLQLLAESGMCIDPEGKPFAGAALDSDEGNGLDPHGGRLNLCAQGRDGGACIDPGGKPCFLAQRDDGSGLDPHGRLSGEEGNGFDPHGKPLIKKSARLDPNGRGILIDPNGKSSAAQRDEGSGLDPNGRRVKPAAANRDEGSHADPNGRPSAKNYQGSGIDPNGREGGPVMDPNGRSSGAAKSDEGVGIDPFGKGMGVDPNGRGILIDPNGKGMGLDPNGRGILIDPNGRTGDGNDAGAGIDPEGRPLNSKRSSEAGVIIDPNGRGGGYDPNGRGANLDPDGRGILIDPDGKGGEIDPNGRSGENNADAGVRMDDNGRSSFIDPNGKPFSAAAQESGPGMDPNGRDSGTSLDPSGRSVSAANREKLIQAFLAANSGGASLSESDLALLNVVSSFRDSRVNAKLAAGFSLLTGGPVSTVFVQSAARSFGDEQLAKLARLYTLTFPAADVVDEWDGEVMTRVSEWDSDILKRNAPAAGTEGGVDEWDGDVLKRNAIDEWEGEVVKRTAGAPTVNKTDEWNSEVIKRGLSGDVLRAELLRLFNARMQLLVRGE